MPPSASAARTSTKTSQSDFNRKLTHLSSTRAPIDITASADEVRTGYSYGTLESLSHTLGLTQERLTHVLGVSERTLQRRKEHGRLSAAESDRLWRIAHVYQKALEAFDGRADEARTWLTTPKHALGGETPIDYLDTEPGARMVEQLLATIEYTMPA